MIRTYPSILLTKTRQIVRKLLTVVLDVEGRLDRSCAVVDRKGLPLRRALLYIADDSADRYLDSQFHVNHTVDIEVSKYWKFPSECVMRRPIMETTMGMMGRDAAG